jgi:hypothetical protein
MILTDKQIAEVTKVLENHRVSRHELEHLTTFNEFNYWWSALFGYRNTLSKFLTNLKEK